MRAYLLCLFLLPTLVNAKGLRPEERTKMEAALTEGRAAFRAKNYKVALKRVQKALPYAARLSTTDQGIVRRNMARCYQAMGRPMEAIAAHEAYLVLTEDDKSEAEARAKSREIIKRLSTTGTLLIRCGGTTAQVSVKGAPKVLPCPATFIELPAQPVLVTAVSPDGPSLQQMHTVVAGKRTVIDITLPGIIDLVGIPKEAKLWVDAAQRSISREPLILKPGQHIVRVEAEGYVSWERPVFAEAGHRFAQAVELEPIKTGTSGWLWAGIGGAVVLAGAAGFFLTQPETKTMDRLNFSYR